MQPKNGSIKIALADDHRLVREGIRALLSSDPTLEVVGEAGDGVEAVEVVNQNNPDVLLLDLRMPKLHGVEVIRQIQERSPHTRIIVLSMHGAETYMVQALREGASAYLPKDCAAAELVRAIHTVASGETYVPEPLRQKAVFTALRTKGGAQPTPRERAVLELAAQGKTSAEIAAALQVSRRTAEAHRSNVMKKLCLKTQTDLVLYAVRQGIVKCERGMRNEEAV